MDASAQQGKKSLPRKSGATIIYITDPKNPNGIVGQEYDLAKDPHTSGERDKHYLGILRIIGFVGGGALLWMGILSLIL